MVFGLYRDPNSSIFPGDRVVENNPAIDVFWLNRIGALVEGAVTHVRLAQKSGDPATRDPQKNPAGSLRLIRKAGFLEIGPQPVAIVYDQPMPGIDRPWFLCPVCRKQRRHMYLRDRIACRRCCCLAGPLDYGSRHTHRHTGIHRIIRWRKQIGADLHLFSEISDRPKHHVRFHRYAQRIRAAEAQVVKRLGGINRDITRRARLRGMIPPK